MRARACGRACVRACVHARNMCACVLVGVRLLKLCTPWLIGPVSYSCLQRSNGTNGRSWLLRC